MNNELGNNFTNMFKGTVKPIKRKNATHPALERYIVIGQSGDLFTKARVWVYSPTIEYPEISIFLSLKNASGSAFTKLAITELEELSKSIQSWVKDIKLVEPDLNTQLAKVNAYIDNYNQYAEVVQEVVNLQQEANNQEQKE